MSSLAFMFSSELDQLALGIMAAGLVLNGLVDMVRSRRARGKPPA